MVSVVGCKIGFDWVVALGIRHILRFYKKNVRGNHLYDLSDVPIEARRLTKIPKSKTKRNNDKNHSTVKGCIIYGLANSACNHYSQKQTNNQGRCEEKSQATQTLCTAEILRGWEIVKEHVT